MDNIVLDFAARLPDTMPDALFDALHALCVAHVGTQLFTCSRFDLEAGQAERIFTSNAEAYPLTGLKQIVPNRWTQTVLDNKRPFLATHIAELRDVFPDHEKIEALGFGAAINIPVFVAGELVGTANLLDFDHGYDAATMEKLPPLTTCATLAFLSYRLVAARS